ncbi:MAG: DUF11 domain-containing protein [Chloroflexi bacterium]|nr:DUF11 domain-containing protein [Chloroflexota bacterium]
MTRSHRPVSREFKTFLLIGVSLCAALWMAVLMAGSGAQASPLAATTPTPSPAPTAGTGGRRGSQAAADSLDVAKTINTGTGDNSFVYDGGVLTYTIAVTNTTGGTITNILILDLLPPDTLDKSSIVCLSACEYIVDTQVIPQPIGGTIVVTVTRQISWTIDALGPGSRAQRSFVGRLAGQADGTSFTNRAFVAYQSGGLPGNASVQLDTTARVRPIQTGQASLSAAPTWLSGDLGGTINQDWGDFDRDGNLDMALGSSIGTTVYRNEQGRLARFWGNNRQTFGVVWGDFAGDGSLQLVSVGDSTDGTPTSSGLNYIYKRSGSAFVQTGVFTSEFQLVRVIAGIFGGNGNRIDLIASTNTLNASCPVRLFRNDGAGGFVSPGECISDSPTAALSAADFDNDGHLDLVLGRFPNSVVLLPNDGAGHFNVRPPVKVDSSITFLPYELKWGDYDGDGYLDLAAAYPLQREVRIYHNEHGSGFAAAPVIKRTNTFLTPLTVEWGDFDGDGRLELAVGDSPPVVYDYENGAFTSFIRVPSGLLNGQLWSMRAVQVRTDNSIDLALTNRDGPTMLFDSFTPRLMPALSPIDGFSAGSVSLGDANGDGTIDVLLGAGNPPAVGARIYYNANGTFNPASRIELLPSGLGSQSVALGDMSGDGTLDVAVGTPNNNQVYLSASVLPTWTTAAPGGSNHIVSWGDENGDGLLDLAVGSTPGPVVIYRNINGRLETTPVYTTPQYFSSVRAIAWADFDRDNYLDLAVASYGEPVRIYHNNHDNTFTLAWTSPPLSNNTSVAWADFNKDGFPDLAIAGYGQPVVVFENRFGSFSQTPLWQSPVSHKATSIAWGDWNNDGYPELAVGNDGQPAVVYANLNSGYGEARLLKLWQSNDAPQTTGVAWGDINGDGQLDLVISQKAGGQNGIYFNSTVLPSHLTGAYTQTMPLPFNPSYVSVNRPGTTKDGYLYSSSEQLSGMLVPTVTVNYRVYDPGGWRSASQPTVTTNIVKTLFEFSIDGGSNWQAATADPASPTPFTQTTRLGQSGTFIWNAAADQAISDDARFRVRVVHSDRVGPLQRSSSTAISPPFRVIGTTCRWPTDPSIIAVPPNGLPDIGSPWQFAGTVQEGSGVLTYYWDFGDGTPMQLGQFASHTYVVTGTYTIRMLVVGEPCPVARDAAALLTVRPGGGAPIFTTYLPLIQRGSVTAAPNTGPGTPVPPTTTPTQSPTGTPTAASTPSATATATATASRTATATAAAAPSATSTPTDTPTPTATPAASATASATSAATATASATSTVAPAPSATSTATPTGTPAARATVASAPLPLKWVVDAQPEPAARNSLTALLATYARVPGIATAAQRLAAAQGAPRPPAATQPVACTTTQLTFSTLGINNQPVVNATGTRVAFWSTNNLTGNNADGNIELFVATVSGSTIAFTQVTSSTGSILGGFNLSPSISADGTRVTFFSDRDLKADGENADGNFEIFVAAIGPSSGVTLTQVTHTTGNLNVLPAISADGRYVAFISDADLAAIGNTTGNAEIFRADLNASGGPAFMQITQTPVGTQNDLPSINTDGTRIAFVSNGNLSGGNGDGNREIFVAQIDASLTFQQVSNTASGSNETPGINGDGSLVTYEEGGNIFLATVGNPVPQQLTTDGANSQPSISGDGTRVTYASGGGLAIDVYDTVLAGASPLASTPGGGAAHPLMSLDGTHTAYVSNRNIFLANCPYGELSVQKFAPASILAGGNVTYTVVVNNAGPSVFTGVVLTDVMPASIISITVSPDQIDDDNTATGFGGGTFQGTQWNAVNNTLELGNGAWNLPDGGSNTGWTSMISNVLLLHLNETAGATTFADTSGHGHSATCSGLNCPIAGAAGQIATALSLDGVNQYASIPDSADLNFAADQDFSIMLWVRIPASQPYTASTENSILEKWSTSSVSGFPYVVRYLNQTSGNAGKVLVGRYDGTNFPGIFSTRVVGDNLWHQIGFVKSGGWLYLYVDGTLDNAVSDTTSGATANNIPLYIGQRGGDTNRLLGTLDEVSMFRRALTSQEIATIYGRQTLAGFGQFDSRVMTGASLPVPWQALSWVPLQPQGKALPDFGQNEFGYPRGGVAMTNTRLLLHLNELAGATSFADTSGNSVTGSCAGAACPTAGVSGRFGTAATFDGVANYISLGNPAVLNNPGAISLEAWVMPQALGGTRNIIAHGFATSPSNAEVFLRINNGFYEAGAWDGANHMASSPIPTGDVGRWVHLIGVYDGASWRLYRNGSEAAVTADPIGALAVNGNWAVGARGTGAERFFAGTIDEVAVLARPLSAAEVADHYNRGALRARLQARSCADALCATGGPFLGPDGDSATYFSEQDNATLTTPGAALAGVVDNPYFQYRVLLESDTNTAVPAIRGVRADPQHSGFSASQGTCSGQTIIVCNIGSMAPSTSVTISIIAQVDPIARGNLVNTAAVIGNEFDRDQFNNNALRSTFINTSADLAVTKISDPALIVPGQPLTYTIVVTNLGGPSIATNVTLNDKLPAGMSLTALPPGCTATTGGVSCGLGSIYPFSHTTTVLHVQVAPGARGVLTNTASAFGEDSDPNLANNTFALNSFALPVVDLQLGKLASADPVMAGNTLTYTLILTNGGPSLATNLVVTDALPGGLTPTGLPAGCAFNSGSVNCMIASLAPSVTTSIALVAPVDPATPDLTSFVNVATVASDEQDSNPASNTVTRTITVRSIIDLAVQTGVSAPVVAGLPLTYTVVVTNGGPSAAGSVLLTVTLPSGAALANATGCVTAGSRFVCDMGPLAPQGSLTQTITLDVNPNTRGALTSVASVTGGGLESSNTNNFYTATVNVNAIADLAIGQEASATTVVAGTPITYTLYVTNSGPSQAQAVVVTDTLPAVRNVTPSVPCTVAGGLAVCALAPIDPGAVVSFTVSAQVLPSARSTLVNAVAVASTEQDPVLGNNGAVVTSTVDTLIDLALAKTASPEPALVGAALTHTLVVANAGPSMATGIVLTDSLPAPLTFRAAGTTAGCVVNAPGDLVNCAVSSIDAGAAFTLTIVSTVGAAADGTVITNTASVAATEPEVSTTNNQAFAVSTIQNVGDLAVTKSAPATVVAGTPLTYTINITNLGPSPVAGVVITDQLPAGVTLQTATGCTLAGTLTCAVGTLDPGVNPTATYLVVVATDSATAAGTALVNTVTGAGDQTDPILANNSRTVTTTVVLSADLVISKAGPGAATAGTRITYTVAITNHGPSQATGVVITDALDANLSNIAAQAAQGSCGAAQTVICNIGTLAVGATTAVTIGADINQAATGTLANAATVGSAVSDPVTGDNTSGTVNTVINSSSVLSLTKLSQTNPVIAGTPITYTVIVTNHGPSRARTVQMTDTLPAGLTFITATSASAVCTAATAGVSDLVFCNFGTLNNNASATATIYAMVPYTAANGAALNNQATVTTGSTPGSVSTSLNTNVVRLVDLGLIMFDRPDPVLAGEALTYTIHITNNGPSLASGFAITQTVAPNVTIGSYQLSGATATCNSAGAQTLHCAGFALAPGASAQLDVFTLVSASTPNLLSLGSVVTVTTSELPSARTDTAATLASAVSPVTISKQAAPSPAIAGSVLTYTIQLVNTSASPATNVTVRDTPPTIGTYGVVATAGMVCNNLAGAYTCTRASLAAGATAVITLTANVSATIADGTVVTNTAYLTTSETLLGTSDMVVTTINRQVGLLISNSAAPEPVAGGTLLTYTLNVTNAGPSQATNVVISDSLPSVVSFSSAAGCTQPGALAVRCVLGDMLPGASLARTIVVTVSQSVVSGTLLVNTASVTATEDLSGASRDIVTSTAYAEVALAVSKSDQPSTVNAGNPLTYTVRITNSGPSRANQVTLVDTLAASVTVSVPGCSIASQVLRCVIGAIDGHSTASFTYSVTTNAALADGAVLTNTAHITASEDLIGVTAVITTSVARSVALAIGNAAQKVGSFSAGDIITYTVRLTNTGPSLASVVQVTDTLPVSVTFGAPSPAGACALNALQMLCGYATLNPSTSTSIIVTGTLQAGAVGPLVTTATVTANEALIGAGATYTNTVK